MRTQFITNDNGQTVGVLLPIIEYEKLIDELDELRCIKAYDNAKTKNESTIPLREAIRLRKKKNEKV